MIENKKKIVFSVCLIALALAGVVFSVYSIYKKNTPGKITQPAAPINYMIPGVPYYGFYNLFCKNDNSNLDSAVMNVLGYWRDARFDAGQIGQKFSASTALSPNALENFFKDNGYETYYWSSKTTNPGEALSILKQYVNENKKIPVIVHQKYTLDQESLNFRVVIGISDAEQKITVQDNNFGNNYKISYTDFDKLFAPMGRSLLAVWPSDKIKEDLTGPAISTAYPERIKNSDIIGQLLAKKDDAYLNFYTLNNKEKGMTLYNEFFSSPSFNLLPSLVQGRLYSQMASRYVSMNNPDEAIKIINNKVLPLNRKVDEKVEGWYLAPQTFYPYFLLGNAYVLKRDKANALKNYNLGKNIYDGLKKDGKVSSLVQTQYDLNFNTLKKSIDKLK